MRVLPTMLAAGGLVGGAPGGCKRPPEDPLVTARVDAGVLRLAAPPRQVRYERKRVVGSIGLPLQAVRQAWTRTAVGRDGVVFEARTGVDDPEAPQVAQRFRYDRDGLAILADGAVGDDGEVDWQTWEPPMVLLPTGAAVGEAWEARHAYAGATIPRACEALASDLCDEGIVAVCDAEHPDFRLVTRDHFCPGQGWSGYESLVVREGRPGVRTWTEGVRRVD